MFRRLRTGSSRPAPQLAAAQQAKSYPTVIPTDSASPLNAIELRRVVIGLRERLIRSTACDTCVRAMFEVVFICLRERK
jgi:hypothetical protein